MLYGSVEYITPSAHTALFFSSEPICYLQDFCKQIFWSNQKCSVQLQTTELGLNSGISLSMV